MRIRQWIGRGLLGLLGLTVVAIGGVYAQSQRLITTTGSVRRQTLRAAPSDTVTLARGAKLMAATGCLACHAANLGGAVMLDDPLLGRLVGSNLTAGRGGVLPHYTNAALDAAIRDGLGWDGRKLAVMPANEFARLADDDVAAIIAFLRAQPPVDHVLPPVAYGPAFRAAITLGTFPFAYDAIDHARLTTPTAPRGATVEHGRYLIGSCTGCHGATLAGGPVHGSARLAPNLTPRGRVAAWTLPEFTRLMRTGVRPDGSLVDAAMPWTAFATFTDEELAGLYQYLKTVPAAATRTE